MPKNPHIKKLRRFFTSQPLQSTSPDLWLEVSETHHLRDSIRLKIGDTCLVTDGEGREAEAIIREFSHDGRTLIRVNGEIEIQKTDLVRDKIFLRIMPALLRQGKTDLLVEKAQELGVGEIWPIFSEHCEVKIAKEKAGKIVERWNRIAREASKQSGSLNLLRISEPVSFKNVIEEIPLDEGLVVFHPCDEAIPFSAWMTELAAKKEKIKVLNVLIGPEGGFSDDEIAWVRWKRNEKQYRLVSLGDVLLRADTAFIGVVAALRFSGILSRG